ncbi:hypothetical protein WMY93_020069 [Mugilogobius chulae]|uniref:EVA1 domain-containing protein n=1 Tax=Mugilogobius chulae TaxID=88201 RepID=A0AAW0NSX4_9GOBI
MEPIRRDMELLSNSMATYAHVRANPESLALFFMMGVCLGLFSALCLLIVGITCRRRRRLHPKPSSSSPPDLQRLRESSTAEAEEEEAASRDSHPEADTTLSGTVKSLDVFSSEEELEKARRLEHREKILREIWRNGQPDVLVTGTGTIGRVHYH